MVRRSRKELRYARLQEIKGRVHRAAEVALEDALEGLLRAPDLRHLAAGGLYHASLTLLFRSLLLMDARSRTKAHADLIEELPKWLGLADAQGGDEGVTLPGVASIAGKRRRRRTIEDLRPHR